MNINIYAKMSAISAEIAVIGKKLRVQAGNSSYKAVSERDVLDAVKPLEEKHGIYSYPVSREIVERDAIVKRRESRDGTATESTSLFMRIAVTYRFVNIDDPTEFIDIVSYGDGIDTGDKAPGKAMTYADKYALLKAYKISTGDDPDATASAPNGYEQAKATPQQIEALRRTYQGEALEKLLTANGLKRLEDMPMSKANDLLQRIAKMREGK